MPLQSKSSIKKSSKKSKKKKKKKSKERAEEEAEMTVRFALNQTELRENLEQPNPPNKKKRLHTVRDLLELLLSIIHVYFFGVFTFLKSL